jgi:hypothetical protein
MDQKARNKVERADHGSAHASAPITHIANAISAAISPW